jgi:hypothetical protein
MSNSSPNPTVAARWINVLFAAVLIVTCVLAQNDQHGLPCLFKAAFHIPCPGCGMTRSFKALWRGQWFLAVRYHPLGPLFFGICTVFLLLALFQRPLAKTPFALPKAHQWLLRGKTLKTLVVLMLGVWAVRMGLYLAALCGVHNAYTRFFLS